MRSVVMLSVVALISLSVSVSGQELQSISIEDCYDRVRIAYPIAEKATLQERVGTLTDQIIQTSLYPEIEFSGRVSYQSDVPQIPMVLPGISPISQDQYNFSVNVSQPLYDGGRNRVSRELNRARSESEQFRNESDMWRVREQLDQLYFSLMRLSIRIESIETVHADLAQQISVLRLKEEQGLVTAGVVYELEAELIRLEQNQIQYQSLYQSGLDMLTEMTGFTFTDSVILEIPQVSTPVALNDGYRPEVLFFDQQQKVLSYDSDLEHTQRFPVVSAFATAAYARPGLNFFDDTFQGYWIAGIRTSWNLRTWINSSKSVMVNELRQKSIDREREAFSIHLNATMERLKNELEQLKEQSGKDKQLIVLQEKILEERAHQLQNGLITGSEYTSILFAHSRAKLDLKMRELDIKRVYTEQRTVAGVSW